MVLISNNSKTILSTALKLNDSLKDFNVWSVAFEEEIKSEMRFNSEKAIIFEVLISYIKQMIGVDLDKEEIQRFAKKYCDKYKLTNIQTDAVYVFQC